MDDDYTIPNHLFTSFRHEFNAIRVIGSSMSPTKINLRLDITTFEGEQDEDDLSDYAFKMEVAVAKIHYFVANILNNSVLLYSNNEWGVTTFMSEIDGVPMTNNVVLVPDEPTDACMSELLMSKFKALAGEAFEVNGVEVESTDSRGMIFTFVGGTPGDSFPEIKDWVGGDYYFSKPWWHRDDASTIDVLPEEGDDLTSPPAWAFSLGFIADSLAPQDRKPNVIRAEFRPKVIEGGKED